MFWNGFYTRKSNFLDNHLQEAGPSGSLFARGRPLILTTTKRAWKMHFWDPLQWDKCVLSVKESNFNEKRSKFSHLLTVRAEGADPTPPLAVSLTVKYLLFFTPHNEIKCVLSIKFQWIKWVKIFTFAYSQGRRGSPHPPLQSAWP